MSATYITWLLIGQLSNGQAIITDFIQPERKACESVASALTEAGKVKFSCVKDESPTPRVSFGSLQYRYMVVGGSVATNNPIYDDMRSCSYARDFLISDYHEKFTCKRVQMQRPSSDDTALTGNAVKLRSTGE